jgi:hypothetical protein
VEFTPCAGSGLRFQTYSTPVARHDQAAAVSQPTCHVVGSRDQFPSAQILTHTEFVSGTIATSATIAGRDEGAARQFASRFFRVPAERVAATAVSGLLL